MRGTKKARYAEYTGKKMWLVEHPQFGKCRACAPSKDTAIVAAAEAWETKWTRLDFYLSCTVCPIEEEVCQNT